MTRRGRTSAGAGGGLRLFTPRGFRGPVTPWRAADLPKGQWTTLGEVDSHLELDGVAVDAAESPTCRILPSGALHFAWALPSARVELLRVSLGPEVLPIGRGGSAAFVWRVATWGNLDSLAATCGWTAPAGRDEPRVAVTEDGFATGTWESGGRRVAIGTEGADRLRRRAASNDGMPARMEALLEPGALDWRRAGVSVTLPPLVRSEECQVHFVVTWTDGAAMPAPEDAWDHASILGAAAVD